MNIYIYLKKIYQKFFAFINRQKNEKVPSVTIDTTNEISLVIDYTKSVEQAIADGRYDFGHISITTKHFPISPEMIGKTVQVDTILFHFNRDINSSDVIHEMNKSGYRPATVMELLALGTNNPESQRDLTVVALGSVWDDCRGDPCAPYISVNGSERGLSLDLFDYNWYHGFCFLGVRK